MNQTEVTLTERLVETGRLTAEQLKQCLQRKQGGDGLIDTLLRQDLVSTRELERVLAELPRSDARSDEAGPDLLLPAIRKLDRYMVLNRLGRGGFGSVYLAYDTKLKRSVALKAMRVTGEEDLPRYRREVEIASSLRHPNIAAVYDTETVDDVFVIAMQYVDGHALDSLRVTTREALETVAQAARALEAAHAQGLIHRDIKPGNLMRTEDGHPYLMDFGTARPVAEKAALTQEGTILGTPAYMSPEQAGGQPLDARTDVYSLGATLYDLLAGRPPFQQGDLYEIVLKVVQEEPLPLRALNRRIDADLETIVARCLEKEPARRYATARDLADDLTRWLDDEPIRARPPSLAYRVRKLIARRRAVALAAGAGLAAVIAVVVVLLPQWYAEARARSEKQRQLERQEAARPALDAGRALLMRLDRLLTTDDWQPSQAQALAEAARAEFATALSICPGHPEALLETGRTFVVLEAREQALEWFDLAVGAGSVAARLERAQLRLEAYDERLHAGAAPDAGVRRAIEEDLTAVRARRTDPNELLFAEGMLAFAEPDYVRAATDLLRYAEATVSDPRGWRWAGHALMHVVKRRPEALEALSRTLKYRPRDAHALRLRGMTHLHLCRYEQAVGDLSAAARLKPEAQTYEQLGHAHARFRDYARAIENYDAALALEPVAGAYNGRAAVRHVLGDIEQSLADYDRAIQLAPGTAEAYRNRSTVRRKLGDVAGAEQDLAAARTANPHLADHYYHRGYEYLNHGDAGGALAEFRAATEIDPRHAQAHTMCGQALERLGKLEAAIESFTAALRIDPAQYEALLSRASAFRTRGRIADAQADYASAIAAHPDKPHAYYGRGLIHQDEGDAQRAIADFTRTIERDAAYHQAYGNRGRLRADAGDEDGALADYDAALRVNPRYLPACVNRGNLRHRRGDLDGAVADYEAALKLAPADWPMRPQVESLLQEARRGGARH